MERDFKNVDENGVPICFGNCIDDHQVCLMCDEDVRDRCSDEKVLEGIRDPDDFTTTGQPDCFGKYYGEYSKKCNEECNYPMQCSKASKLPPDKKVHLPVVNNKTPDCVTEPYKTKPFEYKTSSVTRTMSSSNFTIPPKPYMSNTEIEKVYNLKPHPNPIVPGQFEGEEWYERLGKEFVLRTGESAIKVFAELLLTMFSRIKWAPKVKHD